MGLRAYLLTACGSNIGGQLTLSVGLPITVAGFVAAVLSGRRARQAPATESAAWATTWLSAMVAIGLAVAPRDHPPLWYSVLYRAVPIATVILIGVFAGGGSRAARRAVRTAVALVVLVQLLTPIAIPSPRIDVWSWTQAAVGALLHGVHPYTVRPPDVYGGAYDLGYTNTVYPYMPLTLIANAPSMALFGDYRFGLAACLAISVWLLRAAGRRLRIDEGTLDLFTLALALDGRTTYLVASGYNEPLLMVGVAAFVYVWSRWPRGTAPAVAFLLLPACKQYVLAPALLFVASLWTARAYRALAIGAAVAALTVMPFLVWGWRPTLEGIVFQVRPAVTFRADSLSITALVARVSGRVPWHWLPEATQLIVGAIAYAWLRGAGMGGLLLASALSMFASFLAGDPGVPELLPLRRHPAAVLGAGAGRPRSAGGVTRAILRSVGVLILVAVAEQAAAFGGFLAFCAHHRAWRQVVEQHAAVIPVAGPGVARAGDAIYACAETHCFGPLACHDDLLCVCAPRTLDVLQVAAAVGGSCVVEQMEPSRGDRAGACPQAECDEHLGR